MIADARYQVGFDQAVYDEAGAGEMANPVDGLIPDLVRIDAAASQRFEIAGDVSPPVLAWFANIEIGSGVASRRPE